MQQGSKDTEDSRLLDVEKLDAEIDADETLMKSPSQRMSLRRSSSRGSSRKSFTFNYGIPGLVEIHETEVGEDEAEGDNTDIVSHKKVSFKRLAILNKPEIPQLLLGSVAAIIHGVIFPVFGLLLSKSVRIMYEPPHQLRKDARFWCLMYVGLGIITLLVLPLQNYFFGIAGGKLIERIRSLSFEKVVHQEISWFDDSKNSR